MGLFYTYIQNNSGGSFNFDEEKGITHYVVVEAESIDHANDKAEEVGIYFDGVKRGYDCGCCGNRWEEFGAWRDEATEAPTVWGDPVDEYSDGIKWMPEGKEICVHYLDGRKVWF